MWEIRSWAAASLAAATVALVIGAGLQIARTPDVGAPPVAPVVAVVASSSPSVSVAPTSTPTATSTARATTSTPRSSRTTTTRPSTRTTVARTTADEGPVIFGQTNAEAYRQCVRSPNSPGAAECRRITDAGGRGE